MKGVIYLHQRESKMFEIMAALILIDYVFNFN